MKHGAKEYTLNSGLLTGNKISVVEVSMTLLSVNVKNIKRVESCFAFAVSMVKGSG